MDKKIAKIGNLILSHKNSVVIQTMTNTKTSDIDKTVQQINELENYGLKLVRVAILDTDDAKAIKEIVKKINIPIIADIHFNYQLAILSIENGASKIRINPGNIKNKENLKLIVEKAKKHNVAIRIGINGGSLSINCSKNLHVKLVNVAIFYIKLFESWNFYNIVVSLKHSDYEITKKAYLLANKKISYPLHIGLTEAGGLIDATIKSTLCLSELLTKKIGQTLRISINDDPLTEIKVANKLLKHLKIKDGYDIIACPLCGRNQFKTIEIRNQIDDFLFKNNYKVKVAIMGCNVNGPGEAGACDIGIFIKTKDKSIIYYKGKELKTINNNDIILELKKLILKFVGK